MKIAIDGPAGSGKSSIAKELAKRLNINYIDTGAMYRALAIKLEDCGMDALEDTDIKIVNDRIFLDGTDVSKEIRTEKVSELASKFSQDIKVREKLVAIQKDMAKEGSVVMEGRDICDVVLPDADYKFFINAKPEVRAMRRFLDISKKDKNITYEEVLESLKKRDERDIKREHSPLTIKDDTLIIDNTDLNLEESVEAVLDIIKRDV